MKLNFHSKKEKQTKFASHELISPARRHNTCFINARRRAVKTNQPGPVNRARILVTAIHRVKR